MHKMGQVCVPHPCHSSSHNPRVHCQKTPFAQPNSRAATKKKHDTGGKRVVGDITKERKVGQQVHKMGQGLCTTPMPQPLTQPLHALPKNAICTTKLTGCNQGTITQEGNTSRGDRTQERKEGQQVHKMGQGLCTTPMPQPLTHPSHALPKNAICTTKLTGCDEGRMTQEGNTPRGDITHERKECQQVHKMGQVCAPHPCHNPSHNPRVHCRKTPFAQPNSPAATKEA